jgi:hypothetical protein
LASGELSAIDVTTAFLRRAVLAQKLVSSSRSDPFVKSIATYQYATDKLCHRASP